MNKDNKRRVLRYVSVVVITIISFLNLSIDSINAIKFEDSNSFEQTEICGDVYDLDLKNEKVLEKSTSPSEINNIVVFIRFKGEQEFVTTKRFDIINDLYNGSDESLKTYMEYITYGKMNVNSSFYPNEKEDKYFSYEAKNTRDYYRKKTITNPSGYEGYIQQSERENELLVEATNNVASTINLPIDKLDIDGDGAIDHITYVISGRPEKHGELLWAHKSTMRQSVYIKGKRISTYNFLLQGTNNVGIMGEYSKDLGVIVHEFLHSQGFPDLYRYRSGAEHPVGIWDIMASAKNDPQLPLVYTRNLYGGISKTTPTISRDGEFELSPSNSVNDSDILSYKIKSPLSEEQYFIVEYRKGNDKWDDMLNINEREGLLVYRIDNSVSAYDGNRNGPADHIYVFRPGATSNTSSDGKLDDAILSPQLGEVSFGNANLNNSFDPNTMHFQDGSNSGIQIYDIKIKENKKLAFKIKFPELEGSGIKEDPFIVRTAFQFNNIRNKNTAYYKLGNDIDMSEIEQFEPIQEFYGNLDGNGYTVKNLRIYKPSEIAVALINYIDDRAMIKNITFDNVKIEGKSMVSTIGISNSGVINNVKVTGTVIANGQWAGGIVQSNDWGGKIINSIVDVDIKAESFIGGITSNNYGGTIKDSMYLGSIEATDTINEKFNGAIAARNYEADESIVENCVWDIKESKMSRGTSYDSINGSGNREKGMLGIKLEISSDAYVGEKVSGNVYFSGDISSLKVDIGDIFVEDKDIASSINILKSENDMVEFEFIPLNEGATRIVYKKCIGENIFNLYSNILIKNRFEKEDINKDGVIDLKDVTIVANKYNISKDEASWSKEVDLNNDNIIDLYDLVLLSRKLEI